MNSKPASLNWLGLFRIGWVVFALLVIGMMVAILPAFWELSLVVCPVEADCVAPRISFVAAQILQETGVSMSAYANYQTSLPAACLLVSWLAGVLIFWGKPRDGFALLMSFFLFGLGASFLATPELAYALHPAMFWFFRGQSLIFLPLLLTFFYLFPDGRFVPRWSVFVVPLGILFGLANNFWPEIQSRFLWPLPLIIILGGLAAQIYRYRRISTAEQRRQTKWVLYGSGLAFALLVLLFVPPAMLSDSDLVVYELVTTLPFSVAFMLIPVSILIAILRYQLWDIDLIIRKTLVYTALTATLALVFFGGVTLLQQVVGRLTGTEDSPVAIVLSTLVIAALFSPLRQRIQDFIDQLFYRQKYNAEQALADFAATARNETDLEALTGKLVEVVSQTMQPEQTSIWLARSKLASVQRASGGESK